MRVTRPALCLALAGLAASTGLAFGADAPKTSTTSKTLFMAQEGCGTTAEAGRLESLAGNDGADGCGTVGGLPANEVFHQSEDFFGSIGDDYTSTPKLVPFMIDATKKVTGQVAAESWPGAGGVGTITWDISMTGTTAAGKLVDFGATTVSAAASPTANDVVAPFVLAVPGPAAGQTFKKFTVTVAIRGANIGMSSKKLSGDTYVVIPVKPKPPVKRRH